MNGKNATILWLSCVFLAIAMAAGCASTSRARQQALVDNLESQLYSGDSKTADRAALVLLSYESEDAFKLLRRALVDSSPSTTRVAVIVAFTIQRDDRIRDDVLGSLDDENDEIVALAQAYLEEVIGEPAAPDLLTTARDVRCSPRERIAALKVLGKIGTGATVDGLLDLLDDNDRKVAAAAVAALQGITYQPFENDAATWRSWYRQNRRLSKEEWRQVGGLYYRKTQQLETEIAALQAKLSEHDQELIGAYKRAVDLGMELRRYDAVVEILNNAGPVEAQCYAADSLGKAKAQQAAAPLIEKARGLDKNLAKACITALGQIADPSAAQVVALALTSGDPELRLAAVEAFAALPGSDLSLLLPLRSDASTAVRSAVAKAFGARRWNDGFNALVGALGDQSSDVKIAAAGALGLLGDKTAVPYLINTIRDENKMVRWTVVRSLLLLADPQSFDALLDATRDDESGVKEAAVTALARLGDKRAVDRLLEMTLLEADPRVAEEAWTSLVELIHDEATLMLSLAEKLDQTGRFNRAETLLTALADGADTSPQAFEARTRLARGYLAAGNFQAAASYFRRVLDAHADDRQALVGLGEALKGQSDWAGLVGLYSRDIIAGGATPDVKRDYLAALKELELGQGLRLGRRLHEAGIVVRPLGGQGV